MAYESAPQFAFDHPLVANMKNLGDNFYESPYGAVQGRRWYILGKAYDEKPKRVWMTEDERLAWERAAREKAKTQESVR